MNINKLIFCITIAVKRFHLYKYFFVKTYEKQIKMSSENSIMSIIMIIVEYHLTIKKDNR